MKVERTTVNPEFKPIILTITLETPEEVASLKRITDGSILETPEEVASLKRITNGSITSWGESDTRIADRIRGELD